MWASYEIKKGVRQRDKRAGILQLDIYFRLSLAKGFSYRPLETGFQGAVKSFLMFLIGENFPIISIIFRNLQYVSLQFSSK